MERVIIKKVEGRLARLEDGREVPESGVEVTRNSYVNRQVLAGDVEVVTNEENKDTKKSQKKNSNKTEEVGDDNS